MSSNAAAESIAWSAALERVWEGSRPADEAALPVARRAVEENLGCPDGDTDFRVMGGGSSR